MDSSFDSRLDALHQISQRKLTEILDQIPGRKDLIIDPVLMKPLERITGVSVLRSHGVDKIFKLDKAGVKCVNSQWVYLIYADLITAKYICDQINADLHNSRSNNYHLIFVPRALGSIQLLLEEEGLFGTVMLHNFPWEMTQLDGNVLSLEMPSLFRMLFIDGDRSYLPMIAGSLWCLEMLFGRFSSILAIGSFSSQVVSMIDILSDQQGAPDKIDSEINCVIVVDRDVDYASALLTPVTYVGLLDEVFGISGGIVEFDDRVTGNKGTINHQLSSNDIIYDQIKNRHFSDVFTFLGGKAKELQLEHERSKQMHLQEMKHYVATELQRVTAAKRSLAMHIGACEVVIGEMGHRFESLQTAEKNMLEGRNHRSCCTYIEDCLAMETSKKLSTLRLLCLMALTTDSLSQEEAGALKIQFLHRYGYENLVAFRNLEKLGLAVPAGDTYGKLADRVAQVVALPKRGGAFQAACNKLKLFPEIGDDYDLKHPKDMGYVFGGAYIPAVCQLVHWLIKREFPCEEIVKLIPNNSTFWSRKPKPKEGDPAPRSFLVYFVGGVTYAEISAFQLLEKLTGARILVAGTSIINGNGLVESAL